MHWKVLHIHVVNKSEMMKPSAVDRLLFYLYGIFKVKCKNDSCDYVKDYDNPCDKNPRQNHVSCNSIHLIIGSTISVCTRFNSYLSFMQYVFQKNVQLMNEISLINYSPVKFKLKLSSKYVLFKNLYLSHLNLSLA